MKTSLVNQNIPPERQPVHTFYGGAHLFRADSALSLGKKALDALHRYAPDAAAFAAAAGIPDAIAATVYDRVTAKLAREPVEDFRVDFEDGFGIRPAAEEDAQAARTAAEMARGHDERLLPPFIGIRIKPFAEALRARAVRTLDIFLTTLLDAAAALPAGFAVTLPKVMAPGEVSTLADLLDSHESRSGLPSGSIRIEIMIETPQAIVAANGQFALGSLVDAARGRCRGAHLGPYDYTASLDITAAHQNILHPACDLARQLMLLCLSPRGLFLSDGPTNILPISRQGDAAVVHRAWRLHVANIRHALINGFYQGWDLHPAQLPSRYAAVYSFFLEALPTATERLEKFLDNASRATLVGVFFDDAATGRGLSNYFQRGLACGALTAAEAHVAGKFDYRGPTDLA